MTVRLPSSTHSDNVSSRQSWVRAVHDALGGIVSQISAFLPLTGGTLTGDLSVPDEVYGVGWNGSLEVPTKNAVYDKIETLGSGAVSTSGSPASGNLTKFSGASTITNGDLSGDISTSGTLVTAIGAGKVTLAMQANMATASIVYRKTAGAGAPEVQALATLKTDLGLTGTNSGDQTITLTGDVAGTGTGSFAATIGNNIVTYAKMQDVSATSRILGRITAGAGDTEELTAANVKTILSLAQADISGLTTADSPQFTAVNVGNASDTTVARVSAGDISVEGNRIFRVGGTDVPVADGGTGASTAISARNNVELAAATIVQLQANASRANNTFTAISWGSTDIKSDPLGAWASGSPTRFTTPTGCSKAKITLNPTWASNGTGARWAYAQVNGAGLVLEDNRTANSEGACGAQSIWLTGLDDNTDYFEIIFAQTSGGNLNLTGAAGVLATATRVMIEWAA